MEPGMSTAFGRGIRENQPVWGNYRVKLRVPPSAGGLDLPAGAGRHSAAVRGERSRNYPTSWNFAIAETG
jgi:hypothetical protein